MNEIVFRSDDGQLFTTSEVIAENANVQHKNILELIGRHEADLGEFGGVAFQTRTLQTAGGEQQRRVAQLNEPQSTFLLTLLRNTEQVLSFKKNLVKTFYEMAKQLAQPMSEEEIVAQALAITTQRVKELEPKAKAWETLAAAKGDYSVAEAAQLLTREHGVEIGRNRLFEVMSSIGWVYRWGKRQSWHAYQTQVDNGRLKLRISAAFQNQKTGEMELPAPTIRVTAKGVQALLDHFSKQVAA